MARLCSVYPKQRLRQHNKPGASDDQQWRFYNRTLLPI